MRYGSLCSGIGGLDLAIEDVFDASPAWFCEADPHASLVLARHWPDVPILPDLKTQDWTLVEPVELVCAGYPCQPFSHAGERRGTDDPRHLWPFVADALRVLRPRVVVLENVAGHVSLGFDVVLGDLAALGFDAEWGVVRASDVGACHQRARLFVVAADPGGSGAWGNPGGSGAWGNPGGTPRAEEQDRRGQPDQGHPFGDLCADVADANGGRQQVGGESHGGQVEPRLEPSRRSDADRRCADTPDAAHVGCQRGGASR